MPHSDQAESSDRRYGRRRRGSTAMSGLLGCTMRSRYNCLRCASLRACSRWPSVAASCAPQIALERQPLEVRRLAR